MESFEEAKSEAWEWLKFKYDNLAVSARRAILISLLGSLTLENLSAEKDGIEAGADKDVKIENITKGVDDLMKKYEKEHEAVYTSQISSANGDVIVDIAQMHANPKDMPSMEEKLGTIECQKKIEKFILDLLEVSKKENARILFFNEGDADRDKILEGREKDYIYLSLIASGDMSFDDLLGQIERSFKNFMPHTIDKEKYVALNQTKGFIKLNMKSDDEKSSMLMTEAENRLRQIDINNIYYCGGMDKLSTENKLYISKTEDNATLNEMASVYIHDIYRSEEMTRLNGELGKVINRIKRAKDEDKKLSLEKEKKIILDKIAKEKQRIKDEVREKREDAILDNLLKNIDKKKGDHRKTIYVLNFGAAHDFRDNLKKKNTNIGLLRLNLVSKDYRSKFKIKN